MTVIMRLRKSTLLMTKHISQRSLDLLQMQNRILSGKKNIIKALYDTWEKLRIYEAPSDWINPPPDESMNEPEFKLVDNPSN